ncbi:hypothetical protein AAFC00_004179 [Neodothiora populina]|uniref:Major facilitator superfamily (MFS) profile domain-containing protein n=1 Tax=Neodothiora populina TaxID=2781224 RepID=A0ABR3PJ55_9PEZI
MPQTNDAGLREVPPAPLEDERRPLLDAAASQPNHGTMQDDVSDGGESAEPLPEEHSLKKILVIMFAMWMGNFFAALDSTMVATLASPISSQFQSSTLLSWIASGYLIANAAFQPLSGRLTDIFGRRAGVIWAASFFAIGTFICGSARNAPMLIAGRVIAGIGGGCINTTAVFIASDLIPLRKRGVWQGFANVVYGAGMGLGGVFGGFMNDHFDWRWAFYIQVPFICLVGILGGIFVNVPVKETDKSRISRVDFSGAFLLVTTLVLLLLGLNSGGNIVPWTHPLVLVSLPLSAITFLGFIIVEDKYAAEPIIPVRLLLHRTAAAACLMNFFLAMVTFAMFYYLPIFFQSVQGYSATGAGVRLIPQSLGASTGSLGAGLIMRATGRYRALNIIVIILTITTVVLIAVTFTPTMAVWPPFIILYLNGCSYGGVLTITLLALLASVGHEHQAVITSASYAFRSTGSTIGITLASAVFQNILKKSLWARFGDLPGAAEIIRSIRDDIGDLTRVPRGWEAGVKDGYMESLRGVWVLIVVLATLGGFIGLFIRQHTLHSTINRK